jgi:enterochelin esterase-like enzyme
MVHAASRPYCALLTTFLALGCSSSPPTSSPGAAGSSPVTPSGGSAGVSATGGGGGATAGGNTAGGNTNLGGSAGASVVAGSAGSGGASDSGGAGGFAGATASGITCNPGIDGNGTHDLPGPYGAPPEATPKAGVPVGTLSALTPFQSTIYNHVFGYQIYVPAQYKPGQRAAFMMVQDGPSHYLGGQATEAKFHANVVMDNLIAEGTVPVTIGLFVDVCMQKCDDQRVTIYDDATDKYARFVTEELLPNVISGKYSLVDDAEAWLTMGFSAGAEQGFTVDWNKPIFHKFIGHNTSFPAAKANGADYISLVPNAPNKGFRVSLSSGTMDLSDARGNWLDSNTQMAKVLTDKGYPVHFTTGTGGHYPPDQSALGFPNDLRWMWQGCKLSDY